MCDILRGIIDNLYLVPLIFQHVWDDVTKLQLNLMSNICEINQKPTFIFNKEARNSRYERKVAGHAFAGPCQGQLASKHIR